MAERTCSIEGCDKPERARTWCHAHWARWRRWGDPTGSAPSRRKESCAVEGCERGGKINRGWCVAHYARWRRHGDPLAGRGPNMEGRTCSIDGCDLRTVGRGWCSKHYERWRTHGDPLAGSSYHYFTPEDRWAANTVRSGDCLLWTGALDAKGYGAIVVDGRRVPAHRYAWEREYGPIPEGMVTDHRYHCNPACVEASHLRPATNADNIAHMKGAHSDSTTGVRNVTLYKGKYLVQVTRHGVTHRRYPFADIEEAATVAAELRAQLFGSFAGRG